MNANIAFIVASLIIQLILVLTQNKQRGWKVIASEMAIVLFMIKPAIDASRVASGEAQEEHTVFDQQAEADFH